MTWFESLGKVYRKHGETYFIDVPLKDLDGVWKKLLDNEVTRISSITVNDAGKHFEIIYHFVHKDKILNIKTKISSKKPQVKSIIGYFPGAELMERELWETMGLESAGNPNLNYFLLDEKLSPKKPGLRRSL